MPTYRFDKVSSLALGGLLVALAFSPSAADADAFAPDVPTSLLELHLPQHMTVSRRDGHQWVALETGVDNGNKVERRTSRYSDGSKALRVTEVLSPFPGSPPLYVRKEKWDRSGELTASQRENDAYDGSGVQTSGSRESDRLEHGRVVKQEVETWNSSIKGWLVTGSRVMSYYLDGNLKERVTEDIPAGRKTDETWGPKREGRGRAKTLRLWDAATKAWGAP